MVLLLRHQPGHRRRVSGDDGLVALPGQRVPDVGQVPGVVVHRQDPHPFPGGPPGTGGRQWREQGGSRRFRRGQGEGEPSSQAGAVALGADAAAVGFYDAVADGEPQPGALGAGSRLSAGGLEPVDKISTYPEMGFSC